MDENEKKQDDLLATTDSLEAIGVFRTMKNFLFVIVFICLLLLQISFWLVNSSVVKMDGKYETSDEVCSLLSPRPRGCPVLLAVPVETKSSVSKPPISQPAEPNSKAQAVPVVEKVSKAFYIKFTNLAVFIRFCDYLLILAAVLYCLTMLFSLKISLLARLGGINHISRAFFLALIMLVILCPWQKLFSGVIAGFIYTPAELAQWYLDYTKGSSIFYEILYYLRFVGLWLVTILLLISAQARSSRWAKAMLRRLEIV